MANKVDKAEEVAVVVPAEDPDTVGEGEVKEQDREDFVFAQAADTKNPTNGVFPVHRKYVQNVELLCLENK